MADAPEATAGTESAAPAPDKKPLILALVNTLAILGALGAFVYTRIIYKRPAITENAERVALIEKEKAPPEVSTEKGLAEFEKMTVNIQPEPADPDAAPGTSEQIKGKVHYVTLAFSAELADVTRKDELDAVRPMLMDRLLFILGKKTFHELNTPQGRYILRAEILELANKLIGEPLVTNVYFSEFLVQ